MPVRITGLNSGLDTDAIVRELVSSYSTQKDNIVKKQTKLEWKQDAWKDLNTKIYSFYSSQLSNLRYASAYNAKKTNVSDATKATVKASNTAPVGKQKLEILQTAQSGYLTGSAVKTLNGEKAGLTTAMSALGVKGATSLEVEVGGKTKHVDISATDTIEQTIEKFKDIGLSASFDTASQRFFISSKESGEAANFTIKSSDSTMLTGSELSVNGGPAMLITKASELGITTTKEIKFDIDGERKSITINPEDNINDIVNKMKEIGLDAEFDQRNGQTPKFIIRNKEGENATFSTVVDDDSRDVFGALGLLDSSQGGTAYGYTNKVTDVLSTLGLLDKEHGGSAAKVEGQDAIIKLNDAEFTSKDGNFSINGLTISALEETTSAITINTTVDSQGIYDSIKNFFKEYNTLIKEMDTLFNADNAKGYEPLTDDEKDEMSDTEVEKWEKKIKDSLLRRDSTLGSVSEAMRTALAKSYTINGKSYSLASFGINTQSYMSAAKNEKNLYHIDGDSDDALTKTKDDKLLKAIAENPDDVAEFFSQLVKGTYEALDKKMKSSSMSSAYVVYNDKQITKDLTDYKDKIKKWEDKVKYYEDFYYKKFSGMEKALAQLQSSQNSLSMLIGQ